MQDRDARTVRVQRRRADGERQTDMAASRATRPDRKPKIGGGELRPVLCSGRSSAAFGQVPSGPGDAWQAGEWGRRRDDPLRRSGADLMRTKDSAHSECSCYG
ncbi:hypothetical protein AcW1_007819 [Taiwanofungus camphoratus]|nr:hypothetical protein AcW1_007819 [Antrodia cinnamomea]